MCEIWCVASKTCYEISLWPPGREGKCNNNINIYAYMTWTVQFQRMLVFTALLWRVCNDRLRRLLQLSTHCSCSSGFVRTNLYESMWPLRKPNFMSVSYRRKWRDRWTVWLCGYPSGVLNEIKKNKVTNLTILI